jgi:hypothetical protein
VVDVVTNAITSATVAAAEAQIFSAPAPVDAEAARRFGELMAGSGQPPALQSPPMVEPPSRVQAPAFAGRVSTSSDPATLGDAVLQRMSGVSDHYRAAKVELHNMLNDLTLNEMSVPKLLGFQIRMADVSIQIDLVAKCIGKVDQHVDQLTKLQ